jgi:OOP family OmpA-OmpF porin
MSVQDDVVRIGMTCALVAVCAPAAALADDRFEASAFFGGEYFPHDIGLGQSLFMEQRPQTAPLTGARLTLLALPGIVGDDHTHLDIGLEGEFAFAAAFTGYGFDTGRDSYFSPVFQWRGDLLVRLSIGDIKPHLLVGGGGATVVSSSPYMVKETNAQFVWGAGVTFQLDKHWQFRIDGRQGVINAIGNGSTSTFEGSVGIGTRFGFPREVLPPRVIEPPKERAKPEPDADRDGDGIPDALDKCPNEPETVNGIGDGDGCPEPDPDGDGIVGAKDLCPNEPEDFDHFQDEDGCPDPDNDGDGILDTKDACPKEPETVNGFEDEDGCPDTVPPDLDASLAAVSAVRFDATKARITDAAKKSLDRAVNLLRAHTALHVIVTVHPDKGDPDKSAELAKKRGNAIKGYLIEQGVGMDQISVVVSPDPVKPKGPTIELGLASAKK